MHTLHFKINWRRENTKIAFSIDQADTGIFHIEGKQPLPPFFSVNTFLMKKQKVHVLYVYFQISTFLKMSVYTYRYVLWVYIYIERTQFS